MLFCFPNFEETKEKKAKINNELIKLDSNTKIMCVHINLHI